MTTFILRIYEFLRDILNGFYIAVSNNASALLDINGPNLSIWLNKPILSGDLISVEMTYKEFFIYFGTLFLVVFFIALFVRFVFYIIKWVGGFLSD